MLIVGKEIILHMGQNKLQNLQNDNINNVVHININTTTGYCAKCLKILDKGESKNVIKDAEGNEFCDNFCKIDYWRENRLEIDDRLREWKYSGR